MERLELDYKNIIQSIENRISYSYFLYGNYILTETYSHNDYEVEQYYRMSRYINTRRYAWLELII